MVRIAHEHPGNVLMPGLRVRVRGDRMSARYSTGGRNTSFPNLRAVVQPTGDGIRIIGHLRWWRQTMVVVVYVVAALITASLAAVVAVSDGVPGAVVALLVGLAALLGLIAAGHLITHGATRRRETRRLADALRRRFGTE